MNFLNRVKGSSLMGGAGIYLAASLINASIPFLLLPILTRYLEPSEYGAVAMFSVWGSMAGALCGLSVHGAAIRKYFDYKNPDAEIGDFVCACVIVLVVSSLAFLIFLIPLGSFLSDIMGLPELWLYLGVLYAFCNFLMRLRLGQWQVRKEPIRFGVFQISTSLLNMILSIALVVFLSMGVTGRLSGQVFSALFFGLVGLWLLWRDGLLRWSWRPDLVREALHFGVPLMPHVIGAFFLLTIDRAVIGSQLGLDAAGYYMVAVQFAMVLGLLLDSVNRAYVPWLYEKLKKDIYTEKILVVKASYAYGLFLLLCTVAAFLVGGDVLVFVAGEKYKPAAQVIGWLVLAKAFHGMYYTATGYIFYAKKTGLVAKITVFCGAINVLFLFVFIEHFGLIGASWAMCLSMLLQWLITWKVAASVIHMPWSMRVGDERSS